MISISESLHHIPIYNTINRQKDCSGGSKTETKKISPESDEAMIGTPTPTNNSRLIAFTTPQNYATRLSPLIQLRGWTPIWCPTLTVESTPHTVSSIQKLISSSNISDSYSLGYHLHTPLQEFSAIAFTSRTGISAFIEALSNIHKHPLSPNGEPFIVSALGNDSSLLNESFISKLCENPERIQILVPSVASPSGLVEALGLGYGRKVLCPVPLVVGLDEPAVVPRFLEDLRRKGWVVIRVNSYETRWAGPNCAVEVVRRTEYECGLDAIVFTSTGEVEGLMKSLREFGLDWEMIRKRCPSMLVAAHGPVTASGAQNLGVSVHVVSSRFHSFSGVVDSLAYYWEALDC